MLAQPGAAQAQLLPPTESDIVLILGQVPPGFPLPEAPNVSQFLPAFAPAPGLGNAAVILYEDAAQTIVSDQLWVQGGPNGLFYFASDPDLQNLDQLGIPVFGRITETGGLQDVSQFFGAPPLSIQVQSDLNIPEPSTLVLAGLGMLGVALWHRKHRKQK